MQSARPSFGEQRQPGGFTIVELIAVVATLSLLACLVLPSLARAQVGGRKATCLSNLQQITRGWSMYATENSDQLPRTAGMESFVADPNSPLILPGGAKAQWCPGSVDAGNALASTNLLFLSRGSIWPFVKNYQAYKCPADSQTYQRTPTIRSIAMNNWLNPIIPWNYTTAKILRKLSDMTTLPPERTFVVADENPSSINDGWLLVNVIADPLNNSRTLTWVDYPASYHNAAGCISFADGHVEMRRWTDNTVLTYPRNVNFNDGSDLGWLSSRASAYAGQ